MIEVKQGPYSGDKDKVSIGLFTNEIYPNAEYLARKGFYIPGGLALTNGQMDEVVAGIKDVMDQIVG